VSRYDGVEPYLKKCKTSRAKSVLLGLWTFADIGEDNPKIWPSTEAIARRLGMSVRSVTRALSELETIAAFTKIGGARSTERVLHMDWNPDVAANTVLAPANSGATSANPVRKNVTANPVRQEDKPVRVTANPVRQTANSGRLMSNECPSCPPECPPVADAPVTPAQTTLLTDAGQGHPPPKPKRSPRSKEHPDVDAALKILHAGRAKVLTNPKPSRDKTARPLVSKVLAEYTLDDVRHVVRIWLADCAKADDKWDPHRYFTAKTVFTMAGFGSRVDRPDPDEKPKAQTSAELPDWANEAAP
jgi:hypothetical protein